MAFTVGTNSFVSLDDANAYFVDRGNTTWANASDPNKQSALIRATDYLVQKYTERWKGELVSFTQALPWPRVGVYTADGKQISSGSIPEAIENATSEMGLRALSNSDLYADEQAGRESLKRNKVDVLEKEYFQGGTTQNKYTIVEEMLKDYTISFGNAVPLTRHPYGYNQGGYWGCYTLRH